MTRPDQQHLGHPEGGTWCGNGQRPSEAVAALRPRVPVCAVCHIKAMHYRAERQARAEARLDALVALGGDPVTRPECQHLARGNGGTWCGDPDADFGGIGLALRLRVPVCAVCHMKAMHYRAERQASAEARLEAVLTAARTGTPTNPHAWAEGYAEAVAHILNALEATLAAALPDLLADVWDEGHADGLGDAVEYREHRKARNPYRPEAAAREAAPHTARHAQDAEGGATP